MKVADVELKLVVKDGRYELSYVEPNGFKHTAVDVKKVIGVPKKNRDNEVVIVYRKETKKEIVKRLAENLGLTCE